MNDRAHSLGLEAAIEGVLAGCGIGTSVASVTPLTGGASRSTSRIELSDGAHLILQQERGEHRRRPEGMAAEAAIIRAAAHAGVPVPDVVAANDTDAETGHGVPVGELGDSWCCTRAVPGETIARRILRDDAYGNARNLLPSQLGRVLAQIHRIDPSPLPWLEQGDELAKYRQIADDLGLESPAFEVAFRWLDANRPPPVDPTLVHGDFRLGNLIVDENGLAAVIDWELAHLGDPMEDLGWLCVRAWRFGSDQPVAGVGTREALYEAYEAASNGPVDRDAARWWEILGTLKWGVMCAIQASVHLTGAYRSVELVAIGRRVTEQEHDLMQRLHDLLTEEPTP